MDELKDIPVIMLTSKAQEDDIVRGLELGAQDYMAKPFSPAELVLRVNKAFKRKIIPVSPFRKSRSDQLQRMQPLTELPPQQ